MYIEITSPKTLTQLLKKYLPLDGDSKILELHDSKIS